MADYYTNISFMVTLPDEARTYLNTFVAALREYANDETEEPTLPAVLKDFFETAPDPFDAHLGIEIEDQDKEGIWISDGGDGCPQLELLADILEHVLARFKIDEPISFQWSNTCSKPRLDAFGGGACVITKDGQSWMNTDKWVADQLAK